MIYLALIQGYYLVFFYYHVDVDLVFLLILQLVLDRV